MGVSSGLAVVTYILWGLAPLIDGISTLEVLSPFFWALAGDTILHGPQWGNIALLALVGLGFVGIGIWRFERRDLAV